MRPALSDTEIVEVVLRKKMTMENYRKTREDAIKKGWDVKAYELDYYSGDNLKTELITE